MSARDPYEPASFPEPDPSYRPTREGTDWRRIGQSIWAPIALVVGLFVKFGFAGLKFFGIFISVGGYALLWGWKFAIGRNTGSYGGDNESSIHVDMIFSEPELEADGRPVQLP